MMTMELSQGYRMYLDDDGPVILTEAGFGKPSANVQRGPDGDVLRVYAQARILGSGKVTHIHRTLLAHYLGRPLLIHEEVDHIHHREATMIVDNRRENLRLASSVQNKANARKRIDGISSRYRGVSWGTRDRRWVAWAAINGKRKNLGHFFSEADAARAYNVAALAQWGEYAKLNTIGTG